MDNVKHYAERNAEDLGQVFIDHLMAMTAEQLHRKSAIAAELAYRDQRIAQLEAELKKEKGQCAYCQSVYDALNSEGSEG